MMIIIGINIVMIVEDNYSVIEFFVIMSFE